MINFQRDVHLGDLTDSEVADLVTENCDGTLPWWPQQRLSGVGTRGVHAKRATPPPASPLRHPPTSPTTPHAHARPCHAAAATVVFHLADVVAGIDFVFRHQEMVFDHNMRINMNMINSAKRNGVKKFVYTGTACSFPKELQSGYNVTSIPESKTYPADPESAYGWSKLMGEYELELAKQPGVFDVGIVRFHNLYGDRILYGPARSQALPSLVRKAIQYPQEDLTLWGSGHQYRDFLHVSDAVEAVIATFHRGMNQGATQVGTGKATTLLAAATEVASLAKALLGKEVRFVVDSSKPEGDKGRVADLSRARNILAWKAKVTFHVGMEQMFKWIHADYLKNRNTTTSGGSTSGAAYNNTQLQLDKREECKPASTRGDEPVRAAELPLSTSVCFGGRPHRDDAWRHRTCHYRESPINCPPAAVEFTVCVCVSSHRCPDPPDAFTLLRQVICIQMARSGSTWWTCTLATMPR